MGSQLRFISKVTEEGWAGSSRSKLEITVHERTLQNWKRSEYADTALYGCKQYTAHLFKPEPLYNATGTFLVIKCLKSMNMAHETDYLLRAGRQIPPEKS